MQESEVTVGSNYQIAATKTEDIQMYGRRMEFEVESNKSEQNPVMEVTQMKRVKMFFWLCLGMLVFSTALHAELIAHWGMDDNADSTQISASVGSNATLSGNTSTASVSGKIGTAINFNDNLYSQVDDPGSSLTLTSFTVSAWVKGYVNTSSEMVFTWSSSAAALQLELHDAAMSSYDGSFAWSGSGEQLQWNAETWYNVVWTQSGMENRNYYRDGASAGGLVAMDGHTAVSPNSMGATQLQIGSRIGAAYPFIGSIDDVAVWNTALSASQINAIFSLADSELNYHAGQAESLFAAFAAGPGSSVVIDGRTWHYYETDPVAMAGGELRTVDGFYYLNLGGSGMTTIPEPSSLMLLGLAGLVALKRRSRQ